MTDAMPEAASVDTGASQVIQVIEALDRARRRMLILVAVTCTLWFAPQIVLAFSADLLPRVAVVILTLAGMAGAVAWMSQMWCYHRFQQRLLERPDQRRHLDDERVRALRLQAVYRAWWVLAVNAPIVFFLALDRD